jgi:peptidoglycan/LPS O-acetylase OafA/YrhL
MRIPSLDGLRAVAITLVLVSHVAGTQGAPPLPRGLGELGVRVFFVISGLLITTLLIEEHRSFGRISLGRFFLRRTFRIFPAFFAFLAGLWVAQHMGWLAFSARDWLHAITYTVNYHAGRPWEMGHLWSLSVEEQFYLLWPALLVAFGMKRGAFYAAALIVLAPILRLAYLKLGLSDYSMFETAADSIAMGCLLAFCRDRLWEDARWRAMVSLPAIVALFALAHVLGLSTRAGLLAGETVQSFAIALLIERSIRFPARDLGKLLNAAPVMYVGALSYSLYLWQQPFLNRSGAYEANGFPLNLGLAVACALVCHYAVEKPFLDLRKGIEARLPSRPVLEH